MQPIVTPEEMAAIDRDAPEPVEVLIGRAGRGRGAARDRDDGRARTAGGSSSSPARATTATTGVTPPSRLAAARRSGRGRRRGRRPRATRLPRVDLVIDAAYGTGFRGDYHAPDPGGAPVLAVDIPSGVNGRTGEAADGAVRADETVTFAALKPGLVLLPGRERAGRVHVVDIGLDVSRASAAPRRGAGRRGMDPEALVGDPQVARRGVDRRGLARHDRRGGAGVSWCAAIRRGLRPAQRARRQRRPIRPACPSKSSAPHCRARPGTDPCSTGSGGSRRWSSARGSAPSR